MKRLTMIAAGCLLILSCNNNSESTGETTKDTTTTSGSQPEASVAAPEAASSTNNLMSAMSSMMKDMKAMTMTGDPDHDFAMMMSRHHQGAIDMSQAELASGSDSSLKKMAGKITEESQMEKQQLEAFVSSHKASKQSDFGQKAMAMMDSSMKNHSMSSSTDVDFAKMMVQHHSDGIKMAKEYLLSGKEPAIAKIAKGIITKQPKDIAKLEAWIGNK